MVTPQVETLYPALTEPVTPEGHEAGQVAAVWSTVPEGTPVFAAQR